MPREVKEKPGVQPEEAIAVASLGLLVVITLLNVLTRYFSDESFAWTEEISVFLMVLMTLAGASAVARRDRHIRIEVFYSRPDAGGRHIPRRAFALFGTLVTSLVFVLLAALFGRWVWDQYRFSETSMGLGVPLWWYGAAMAPLCLALALRAAAVFMRLLRQRGETAPAEDGA